MGGKIRSRPIQIVNGCVEKKTIGGKERKKLTGEGAKNSRAIFSKKGKWACGCTCKGGFIEKSPHLGRRRKNLEGI